MGIQILNENIRKKRKEIGRIFILIGFPICQLLIISDNYLYIFKGETIWDRIGLLGILLSIITEVFLCWIFWKNAKREEVEKSIREIEHSRKLEEVYAKKLESQKIEIEEKRKSMQKKIQNISQEILDGKDAEEVLTYLKMNIEAERRNPLCKNVIINAVLDEKEDECKRTKIKLISNVVVGELPNISKLHLCSIMSNLLDNAISATGKLPIEKRKIWVIAGIKAEYLIIKVINNTSEIHVTRTPSANHGYGKQILMDIVQMYDGSYETENKNGLYKVTIIVNAGRKS